MVIILKYLHWTKVQHMNTNENLIRQFYTYFSKKDFKGMQGCYAQNASFSDSIFKDLSAKEVQSMWEMLIKSSKDMRIEFGNVEASDDQGSADWIAYYTFSPTGKKVVNRVKASFTIKNGQITNHIDDFDFYRWSRQALGLLGLLWDGSPF